MYLNVGLYHVTSCSIDDDDNGGLYDHVDAIDECTLTRYQTVDGRVELE